MTGPESEDKKTVRVTRRRRTGASGEPRQRAEAPRRDRQAPAEREEPARSTTTPRSTQPAPRSSAPRTTYRPSPEVTQVAASAVRSLLSSGKISPVVLIGLVAVFACCVISVFVLWGMGGGEDTSPTATYEPVAILATEVPLPTRTLVPYTPAVVSSEGQTWLIMLYQDADDKILEQDICVDLNEAERVGSTDRVHIVAQLDRYQAGYQGDGNWTSTKRFYVTRDDDLSRVGSQLIQDMGEVNMADGDSLVDFCTWAIQTWPADKYVLILSDHGMGWPGGWSDSAPAARGDAAIPLAVAAGDQLYLMEIDDALGEIRRQTGLQAFEVIGLDACLMGHVEVLSALAPHARYAVASQETEPALGWAYASFIESLTRNPDMGGAELGRLMVSSYIEADERILDDQARNELLRQGSPMGGLFGGMGGPTAAEVAEQMGQSATLSAIDLAAMPDLIAQLNGLAYALQDVDQAQVARARTYALSFTSVFGREAPPSYIDLGNWVKLVRQEIDDRAVTQAADGVLAALDRAVVAEKHGTKKRGATGISIYFPTSQLYRSPITGAQSYTAIANRFAQVSLWDDLLGYHYTGRGFDLKASELVVPEAGEAFAAPGVGQVQVSPITLSSRTAAPGRPVLLSADISGQNLGYVYLLVGYLDQAANSIFVADQDYLESSETREIDGVYYPVWPEGETFALEFEWEPLLFAISDGVTSVTAQLKPERYGEAYEEAIYSVDGIYTYGDGGESRYARLYFRDGSLRQVFGFTSQDGTGAPHEIIPEPGDTFSVLERWLDLDEQGKAQQVVTQVGGMLTFGDQMFTWEEQDAAAGNYIVGFVVEDLDGNSFETYEQITVQ